MCNKEICNKDIREYAKNNDIPLWRIELPEEKKTEIKAIIDDLAAE